MNNRDDWYKKWVELSTSNPKLKHSDFTKGMVVQMSPGYHTNNSYYVEIVDVGMRSITTSIPDHHQVDIIINSDTWNYHVGRMTIVGTKSTHGHLLYNQKLD